MSFRLSVYERVYLHLCKKMDFLCAYKLLLVISVFLSQSYGFNLDINHPIVYEDPLKGTQTRGSYFGFSVVLNSGSATNGFNPWIQIGAPRGNDSSLYPNVIEPGVVFRCPIAGFCQSVKLDDVENKHLSGTGSQRYQDWKHKAWIGGSMDIQEKNDVIAVCGHRWRNTYFKIEIDIMVGVCYSSKTGQNISSAVGVTKLLPLLDPDKYTIPYKEQSVYYYGVGQAGTSVHIPLKTKKTELLIGAPGVYIWKGTAIRYIRDELQNPWIKKPHIFDPEKISKIRYFGYQVNSGEFYSNKMYYVVGSPRGEDYKGSRTMFKNPQKIRGNVVGAYFGTAVTAAGDLDKDGYADIVVGAPFENERGAIYIYNGGDNGLVMSQRIVATDIAPNIMGFGISIARAADIDLNKYIDVAVGAFKSGHVVLLRSYPVVTLTTTANTSLSQLQGNETEFYMSACFSYAGKDVPQSLNIEREIVLDEEYERASIAGQKKPYKRRLTIPKSGKCEDLKILLMKEQFSKNLFEPITITVNQTLIADRANSTLVLIRKDKKEAKDEFRKFIPVVNEKQSINKVSINVPITTGCGNDNICESDLQLQTSFPGLISGGFIIGSKSKLEMQVYLTNFGEPAYSAGINVTIPFPLNLAKGYMHCQENPSVRSLQLTCDLGNPLRKGAEKSITLLLDMSGVKVGTEHITFNISTFTKSRDKNERDNFRQLHLNLITDADVVITGKPEEDVYAYYKTKEIKFNQIYEVLKIGWSPIDVVDVNFDIPIEWKESNGKNITLLKLYALKAFMNNRPLVCSSETISFYEDEYFKDVEQEEEIRAKRDVSDTEDTFKGYKPPANRTLFLNCSTPNVICGTIKCTAGPFDITSQSSVPIVMKMSLQNSDYLGPLMGKKDIIYISTRGSVTIKKPHNLKQTSRRHSVTVSSIFIGTVKKTVVATWIYALAIIGGILLFMFLVLGLMKAGFFERKKKEELKALKVADAMSEFNFEPAPQKREYIQEDQETSEDD
ncbi:integrin alpha-PS3-like isoform X4 [Periplaneta americana]|uniref:integrin alpha-PS3-like isoform X4 n=1 Tax=Periplaneta americana TaxID=6978 RepID=UPI0037E8BF14